MTIDLFGWLRRKAHDAVMGGISDAVQEIRRVRLARLTSKGFAGFWRWQT